MEWKEIEKEWPPEDMDVLVWDGKNYSVSQLCWTEGKNNEIPVFQCCGSFGNRDVFLWCFLPVQPERLNPEARKGCDSLNSAVMSREGPEEVLPPDPFKCAKCNISFDPRDWQNDVCDDCLYNRKRS